MTMKKRRQKQKNNNPLDCCWLFRAGHIGNEMMQLTPSESHLVYSDHRDQTPASVLIKPKSPFPISPHCWHSLVRSQGVPTELIYFAMIRNSARLKSKSECVPRSGNQEYRWLPAEALSKYICHNSQWTVLSNNFRFIKGKSAEHNSSSDTQIT